MVEKKELEEIKKTLQTTLNRKPIKDIQNNIFQIKSLEIRGEPKERYEVYLKLLVDLRVRLLMEDKDKLLKDFQGKTILDTTEELMKQKFPSPNQKFIPGEQKYRIAADGSECDPTNLVNTLNNFDNHQYENRIGELAVAISNIQGEIARIDNNFWSRDDGIEEITLTKDENNGRKQSGSEQSPQ